MTRTLRLLSLYPGHMNVYGDRGNMVVLTKRLEWRGYRSEVIEHHPGDSIPTDVDLIVGGGGQDSGQLHIQPDLQRNAATLRGLAEDEIPMLMICGLYQLFGHTLTAHNGSAMDGIGILDVHTVFGRDRITGNVTADTDDWGPLVGYENHAGRTFLGVDAELLGTTATGSGNNGDDGTEGARYRNIIGTYLHGPVLPKNPALADALLTMALSRQQPSVLTDLPPLGEKEARATATTRRR